MGALSANARPTKRVWLFQPNIPADIPELYEIGRDTLYRAGKLPPERHQAMEICYIERGMVNWWAEETMHEVSGGNVYITWPGEWHGGNQGALHPCKLYWACVALRPRGGSGRRSWLGLPADEADMLIGHLAGIRQRCFPGPRILSSVYDRIIEILGRPCDRLEVAEARTKLLDLLFMVLHASRTMKAESRSPLVNRAVKLMEERVQDRFSLPKIAAQLGVSLSHFQHRFRRETGIAPAEFLLRRKISEACSRLRRRDAGSITQIALGLGFSSSDYFATAFKRITGLTPLEFRKTQD